MGRWNILETEGDQDKENEVSCTYRGKPNGMRLFQKGINHLPQKHTTAKKDHPTHSRKHQDQEKICHLLQ